MLTKYFIDKFKKLLFQTIFRSNKSPFSLEPLKIQDSKKAFSLIFDKKSKLDPSLKPEAAWGFACVVTNSSEPPTYRSQVSLEMITLSSAILTRVSVKK